MSPLAQVDTIFMPTGYTPAMHAPTMKRSAGTAIEAGSAARIIMFEPAATSAADIKKRRESSRSASPNAALVKVPTTNPAETLLEIRDTC